jgi:hypothetical protein
MNVRPEALAIVRDGVEKAEHDLRNAELATLTLTFRRCAQQPTIREDILAGATTDEGRGGTPAQLARRVRVQVRNGSSSRTKREMSFRV